MAVNPARRPHLGTLADWIEGRLDEKEAPAVAAAVERDADLADDVAWLRGVQRSSRQVPLVEPPALLGQRLHQDFRRFAHPSPSVLEPRVAQAVLVFDSREEQLAQALRGVTSQEMDAVVSLVWRTDDLEVVAQTRRTAPDLVRITGQVLTERRSEARVFEVVASGPGGERRAVDGDRHGRFRIEVEPGTEQLRLSNGERVVVVDLELDARRDG